MPVHVNKALEYSTDPESALNEMRRAVWAGRLALGRANRSKDRDRISAALRQLSKEKAKLRRIAYMIAGRDGPNQIIESDFDTTVCGIPCGIAIDSYTPYDPGNGIDDPGEPECWEYTIVDQGGYRAPWIERKMTAEDERILDEEIAEHIRLCREEGSL